MTGDKWQLIRDNITALPSSQGLDETSADAALEADDPSLYDVTSQMLNGDGGVVLDAHREVRVKLYLGQVSGPMSVAPRIARR